MLNMQVGKTYIYHNNGKVTVLGCPATHLRNLTPADFKPFEICGNEDAPDWVRTYPDVVCEKLSADETPKVIERAPYIVERFGRNQAGADKALIEYQALLPAGLFEVRPVRGALGPEFAVVQMPQPHH